jgi:3-oxoadipate enol-lactonase
LLLSLALIATVAKTHPVLETRAEAAEKDGMEAVVPESIIRWFLPQTIARDDWMVRYARSCVRRARVEGWAAAWRAMAALDCIERLGEIDVPILCLCGQEDASTPPELMKPTFEACKHGEYRELDPGTHMMVMEQAEAAAAELAAFRKRIDEAQKVG